MLYTSFIALLLLKKGIAMNKVFKATVLSVASVFAVFSVMLGVFAAHKMADISFGDDVYISGLEKEDDEVGMINILLIGVDEGGYRSDTIMLVSVDGYSNRANILSIPRDTMVKAKGYTTQKINALMGFGHEQVKKGTIDEPEELLVDMVKELTGLPINYFVTVDFDGFKEVIDALGGVDFNVPYNMNYDDPTQNLHIHLKAGQQHLDGQAAHDFVRFRHNNGGSAPGEYVWGDEGREYWQQEFIKELLRQKLKPQYISKVRDLYEVIKDNVRTNYTMRDLISHIGLAQKIDIDSIGTYQLPGESKYMQVSGFLETLWWYVKDEAATKKLVNDVFLPKSVEAWEEYVNENPTDNRRVSALEKPSGNNVSSDITAQD